MSMVIFTDMYDDAVEHGTPVSIFNKHYSCAVL
jgi:hypothetical protein